MRDNENDGVWRERARAYGRALAETTGSLERREFLRLMGASIALAGASGCGRETQDKIVPYVVPPPELTPGRPTFYTTSVLSDGHAIGLVATCHDGRPTKLEGNPDHPASVGAAGRLEQAAVLGLYDPDRAKAVREGNAPRAFAAVMDAFGAGARDGAKRYGRGTGLHFLLEPTTSPLVAGLVARVRDGLPEARFHFARPFDERNRWQGARAAFGRVVDAVYRLERADVIVSLDCNLLDQGPAALRYARDFSGRRRVRATSDSMSRLYVAEHGLTVTGANADERLRAKPSEAGPIALLLLAEVLGAAAGRPIAEAAARGALPEGHRAWVRSAARALRERAGASLFVVGESQPAVVHALAHAINDALGNSAKTVQYIAPPVFEAGEASHGLEPLARALDGGEVDTLVILEGNPAYWAPPELDFVRKVARAKRRLYLGAYENETARTCEWFVPAAHVLESWGDARAFEGTASLLQPLVVPLHGGTTVAEMLAVFTGDRAPRGADLLRASWGSSTSSDPEFWETTLKTGVAAGSASPALDVTCDRGTALHLAEALAAPTGARGLELYIGRDTKVGDGRHANNAWLQELPDPLTTLTWGNAALVSIATAERLGLQDEDLVDLNVGGRVVRVPALVAPGVADDTVALSAGYGREGEEHVAHGVGANAFALASGAAPAGVELTKTGTRGELALTQNQLSQHGRAVARHDTLAAYRRDPEFATRGDGARALLYFLAPSAKNQWAMTIDLSVCTGCSACVVACQAENNVPVVGFEGVRKHREMHWLRLDRYLDGPASDARAVFQPMLCQHCETAPCEYVCPVNATSHSDDGLNQMTYNRCVGTRFCSNNCPYKVRRFNYFNYNDDKPPTEKLAMNPSVTVRARGVMEKCSFCVQRIRAAEIIARGDQRALGKDEVTTACQQACPTRAIAFGSLTDADSEVRALSRNERAYDALGELGTRPRVRYLARLTNPQDEVPG